MKLLSILALLSFSAVSMASDSFTCKTTTMITEDKKIEIRKDKDSVHFEGLGPKPILESVSMQIDGQALKDCLTCETSYECLQGLVPDTKEKDDSRLSLLTNLLILAPSKLENDVVSEIRQLIDVPSSKDIDVAKIRSGTLHVLQFGGLYPNLGVYEYFDENGALLGRMYHEVLPRMCR